MRKCLTVVLLGLLVLTWGCAESLTQSNQSADKKPPCACKSPAAPKPVDKQATE
jgi:hypothetical protein